MHFQREVDAAPFPVFRRTQVRQRFGIAIRPLERGHAKRRQRLHGHDPGRDGGGKALGQERSQRLIFPGLNVARRPVVEQAQAEDVRFRLGDRDRLAQIIAQGR